MELNIDALLKIFDEKSENTGNLCLGIFCTDCNAQFEINAQAIVIAVMTNATIWDYIKFVQNSKCKVCKPD